MTDTLRAAERLARRIASAHWQVTFEHGVTAFIHVLATIPDYRPRQVTGADVDALRCLAEEVIQLIEHRLDGHGDRQSVQRRLAEAVYRIREETESIALWHRHYRAV